MRQTVKKSIKQLLPSFVVTGLKPLYHKLKGFKPATNRVNKACQEDKVLKKNSYAGERIFIIGGGPSLAGMDLSILNQEYTMVCNRGYLLKDKGLTKTTFYGLSDVNAMREYGKYIPDNYYDFFCLFGRVLPVKNFKNISFFDMYSENAVSKCMYNSYFQGNLGRPIAFSYTVVLHLLQLAVWLGFKEIYFIGVDNNFSSAPNMHWYKDSEQEKKNMEVWNIDPVPYNSKAFEFACQYLKKKNVHIYNAGVGGNLDEIPRVNFDQLF